MYQEPLVVTFDASAPPWPPLDRGRNRGSPKRDKSLNFPWGPVPHHGGPLQALIFLLWALAAVAPNHSKVYPAHS